MYHRRFRTIRKNSYTQLTVNQNRLPRNNGSLLFKLLSFSYVHLLFRINIYPYLMLLSSFSFSLYKASFHVDPTQPTLGLANNLSISIKVTVHNLVPPSFSSIDLFGAKSDFCCIIIRFTLIQISSF